MTQIKISDSNKFTLKFDIRTRMRFKKYELKKLLIELTLKRFYQHYLEYLMVELLNWSTYCTMFICSLLFFGFWLLLFFNLLSLLVLKVAQVASLTNTSRIQLPISMFAQWCLFLSTLTVIAVSTESLRVVCHVCVLTFSYYAFRFSNYNFVLLFTLVFIRRFFWFFHNRS